MVYRVIYDYRVPEHDIPALSSTLKHRIQSAIGRKLITHPDLYGEPLRRNLAGYWKLRVSDYRVVFRIDGRTVKVLMIEHRSSVYKEIMKRLSA